MAINDNDSRVRRTKRLIKKGLCELSQKKSITKITVKELTDLVEINRGTFYLHYKDIFELVEAIENELYEEFEQLMCSIDAKDCIENTTSTLENFCEFVSKNGDIFAMLLGPHGDAEFSHKIGVFFSNKIKALIVALYPQLNPERYSMVFEYCRFGGLGLLNEWLTQYPHWTAHQVAELWEELLSNGISRILGENIKGVILID